MSYPFNLRKNIVFAVAEFASSTVLLFVSYRLVIVAGGVEAIGLWSTLVAWIALVRIGDIGMANASLRFVAQAVAAGDGKLVRSYIQTGIIANAVLFGILAAVGYLASSYWLSLLIDPSQEAVAREILPPLFASFYLLNLSGVVLGSLQGLHLGYLRSLVVVGGCVIQMLAALALVPSMGTAGLAWAQLLQNASTLIAGWMLVRGRAQLDNILPQEFSTPALWAMLGFSAKAQVANISNGLFEPVSKLLVGRIAGPYALGLFELAFKTVWLPRTAVVAGSTAAIPAMTALFDRSPSELETIYRKSVTTTVLLVSVLMLGIVVATPLISLIWIGHFSVEYCVVVGLLALGALGNAAGAPAYHLATVTGVMRNNIVVNLTVLVVLAGLSLAAAHYSSYYVQSGLVALCMALGGLWVKARNERLLTGNQ